MRPKQTARHHRDPATGMTEVLRSAAGGARRASSARIAASAPASPAPPRRRFPHRRPLRRKVWGAAAATPTHSPRLPHLALATRHLITRIRTLVGHDVVALGAAVNAA